MQIRTTVQCQLALIRTVYHLKKNKKQKPQTIDSGADVEKGSPTVCAVGEDVT